MSGQIDAIWRHSIESALEREGAEIYEDQPHTILTSLVGSGDSSEGHFRVDLEHPGRWHIFDGIDRQGVVLSGEVAIEPLVALVVEQWRLTRHRYLTATGAGPSHFVSGTIRAIPINILAERLVARWRDGEIPEFKNNPGFDVLLNDGTRIQVKSSVRNPKSQLVSTIKFGTDPAYFNHDELVYVEFTSDSLPARALIAKSNDLRAAIANDRKTHQVWSWMEANGSDVTEEIMQAFADEFG